MANVVKWHKRQEEFEDTKGLIRIRKSKKNRQHNDQKDKQRSTKHIYKTKDRVNRTPLKSGDELRSSGRVSSSCTTSDTLVRSDLLVVSAPIQYISSFPFCIFFLLAIVLSVLLRYTDSDCPFGIFKFFLSVETLPLYQP